MNQTGVIDHITGWLRGYVESTGTKGFVIGVSGGIDSAVTSTLGARTGFPVTCVEMPIHQAPSQVTRANDHIAWLRENYPNVDVINMELTDVFDRFVGALPPVMDISDDEMPLVNTRARLRMTSLYYFAAAMGRLVLGTGNKVEDFGVGFYTKYGDGGVDVSPIADLVKSEVFDLGRELGVISSILTAAPTDGLWGDDRTDEDQIGASYPELEWAMAFEASGETDESALDGRQAEVLAIYRRLHRANRHKMDPIPVCLIPEDLR